MADPLLGLGLPLLLLLAGTVMMLAEAVIPGAQFVVVGVALFFSGLVGVLLGGPFSSVVALALMTVAFGTFAYFAFREMDLYNGPDRGKTSDSDDLSGETAIVTETITATGGAVRLATGGGFDPNYRARSVHGEIEEGEEVIVTDPGGGSVLTVTSMDAVREDSIDRELARGRENEAGERAGSREGGAEGASTTGSNSPRNDSASSGTESSSRDDEDSETETETERA
jgi:membrane protein implicated in regulation of membrane protease activity